MGRAYYKCTLRFSSTSNVTDTKSSTPGSHRPSIFFCRILTEDAKHVYSLYSRIKFHIAHHSQGPFSYTIWIQAVNMSFAAPALPFTAALPARIISACRPSQRRIAARWNKPSSTCWQPRQHGPQIRVSEGWMG